MEGMGANFGSVLRLMSLDGYDDPADAFLELPIKMLLLSLNVRSVGPLRNPLDLSFDRSDVISNLISRPDASERGDKERG